MAVTNFLSRSYQFLCQYIAFSQSSNAFCEVVDSTVLYRMKKTD